MISIICNSHRIQLVLLKSLLIIGLVLTMPVQAYAHTPQSLYDAAWKLINSKYVDKSTNGQSWESWRHKYDAYLKTDEDAYVAIDTMLASLNDPYTRFLNPEDFKDENSSIRGNIKGIGVQINIENNMLIIDMALEGTPAARAGLKKKDCILEIDGKSTKGMSLNDATNNIRGEEGTYVKLLVRRNGIDKVYNIQRESINIKSVSTALPPGIQVNNNIGYIRLNSFINKTAASEFERTLASMDDKSAYIIDLRSNPGGLLFNALYISNLFLNDKPMVSTIDRVGYQQTIKSTKGLKTKKPIVILINGDSASASEILSGALRDNNRAILVGEKTFGKGLVQEINRTQGNSGMNITIQKYLTPKGTDINKKGITPDYIVKMTDEDVRLGKDPQLKKAQAVLLSTLTNNIASK